jgi:hypothetical protein
VRRGLIDRQLTDKEIVQAITTPPSDTRAALRTRIAKRFDVESIDWSRVTIRHNNYVRDVVLNDPLENDREDI